MIFEKFDIKRWKELSKLKEENKMLRNGLELCLERLVSLRLSGDAGFYDECSTEVCVRDILKKIDEVDL